MPSVVEEEEDVAVELGPLTPPVLMLSEPEPEPEPELELFELLPVAPLWVPVSSVVASLLAEPLPPCEPEL